MAAQPSSTDIQSFCELTGVPESEAIARLKGNNNDLSQAMNEFFDNPDSRQYVWDDTAFSADRDGLGNNNLGISFQVQGPDEPGGGAYGSGAFSRPPSRTSNRSPINGRIVSLAEAHAQADPRARMTEEELADVQLQKALAASAEEAGLPLAPQEYGTTGQNGVYFGPANRPEYESAKWDLVTMGSAPAQGAWGPEPADRKREDGAPAFLKPSPANHRLPSLLTIYHEIPLAREIFLDRGNVLNNYGSDSRWWDGVVINLTRSAPIDVDDNEILSSASQENPAHDELQRLMAFLGKTERSYGSADILANMPAILNNHTAADVESKFFESWRRLNRKDPIIYSIFSRAVQPTVDNSDDNEISKGAESHEFSILDLTLPSPEEANHIETLYDLADDALWANSGFEVETSAFISHLGDIVSFRFQGGDLSHTVSIPAVWYPDRYFQENTEGVLEMRKQRERVREEIATLMELEDKLTYLKLPNGKQFKVQDIFNTVLLHDSEPAVEGVPNGVASQSPDVEMEMVTEPRVSDRIDVSAELSKVMASIDKKLQLLNLEKERARSELRALSKLYTEPTDDPRFPPLTKYTLRGVSATKNITYLRRQAEPDLIDMDLDATESPTETDQWWKITWKASDAKPVSAMKVTQDQVLESAMKDSKTPILVYASEKAMAEPARPLPEALENFVQTDNAKFREELSDIHELQDSQGSVSSPKSPGKRKWEQDSQDSQDTILPRYQDQPRWGGISPSPNGERASFGHFEHVEPKSIWDSLESNNDVIMGQDPNDLIDASVPEEEIARMDAQKSIPQEMQVKKGVPSLMPSAMEDVRTSTEDVMYVESSELELQGSLNINGERTHNQG